MIPAWTFFLMLLAIVGLVALVVVLADELRRTRRDVERTNTHWREHHRAEMSELHESYRLMIQTTTNAQQFGTVSPKAGFVEYSASPEERAEASVNRDVMERGIAILAREYEASGIAVTREELESEALAIMGRRPIEPPASVAGLVRD